MDYFKQTRAVRVSSGQGETALRHDVRLCMLLLRVPIASSLPAPFMRDGLARCFVLLFFSQRLLLRL